MSGRSRLATASTEPGTRKAFCRVSTDAVPRPRLDSASSHVDDDHEVVAWARSPSRVTLLRAEQAKGLEFDVVVLAEPERLAAGEVRQLRLLYIAITRAVLRLVLVQSAPLPARLGVGA